MWRTASESVRPASPQAEPRVALTLAVAVLKGDKMDDVVRDAVMLGAAGVQPLLSRRTEISAAALARSGRVARWQRIAVSSAKQCGRAVVPPVAEPVTFDAVLTRPGLKILLVEPERGAGGIALSEVPDAEAATLIVGPEGGWTDDEIERARAAGCMLLTLGPRTLRADAVPIVAMTALRVRWGDL